MDLINDVSYKDLRDIYNKYFSIGFLGNDINNKFALISLVCYITDKLKSKNPDWTHWQTLYKINQGTIPEKYLKALAIICEDFAYNCNSFPTFNLTDKQIPEKIKELLNMHIPF